MIAGGIFLVSVTMRAECVNSLQVQEERLPTAEAVESPTQRCGALAKVSNAQIVYFAKFGPFPDSGPSCRLRRTAGEMKVFRCGPVREVSARD